MNWNWQQPDWPHFRWRAARLRRAEEQFLVGAGVLAGVFRHLSPDDREQVMVESLSEEALTTSAIEGEMLDRASVQSSLRRGLGLVADRRRARPAERGVAEMMVDLYGTYAEALTEARLAVWHGMLLGGRRDLKDLGRYRTGSEPMEIVSGRLDTPRAHFEAPPAARVPREMAGYIRWFNASGPAGDAPLPALTRAGAAHLYFESIHPFEDGNGRLGRAIAEVALAQSYGGPTVTALAATMLARRKAYYAALEAASRDNEITAWLAWFAGVVIEAQRRATVSVEFLIEKARLLDRLRGELNARQEKVLLRMLREGPEGFKGGLSAGNYTTITAVSPATATRDLSGLVTMGALRKRGELRHTRYEVALARHRVRPVVLDENGDFE